MAVALSPFDEEDPFLDVSIASSTPTRIAGVAGTRKFFATAVAST